MCRHLAEGGRRCPGHDSPDARDKHNERRRRNRGFKAGMAVVLQDINAPSEQRKRLGDAAIPEAKAWAYDVGIDPDVLIELAEQSKDGQFKAWSNDEELPEDIARAVRAAMHRQGHTVEEQRLLTSRVIHRAMPPNPGTNVTWEVTLENGEVGYAKPFAYLNQDVASEYGHEGPWQPIHEVAAWQLARQLGGPWDQIVAPCVIREVDKHLCSVSKRRTGEEHTPRHEGLSAGQALGFFDALIGQQDRHHENVVFSDEDHLSAIDHGYTFMRESDSIANSAMQFHRIRSAPWLVEHERQALRRILASPTRLGLSLVLTADRVEDLASRAERMLKTDLLSGTDWWYENEPPPDNPRRES